jgi:hypothetical protein
MATWNCLNSPSKRFAQYLFEAKILETVAHRSLHNTPDYPTMKVNFIYA